MKYYLHYSVLLLLSFSAQQSFTQENKPTGQQIFDQLKKIDSIAQGIMRTKIVRDFDQKEWHSTGGIVTQYYLKKQQHEQIMKKLDDLFNEIKSAYNELDNLDYSDKRILEELQTKLSQNINNPFFKLIYDRMKNNIKGYPAVPSEFSFDKLIIFKSRYLEALAGPNPWASSKEGIIALYVNTAARVLADLNYDTQEFKKINGVI